ncbi:twin arginine-targeting protein translocase TatC [Clostridium aceticum]|uniref:Sec-independent protein translocase protein TatC n=1 Tax=Clostridium aceticum TaxID=84022 RepID=A0A0G3WA86_9CLOT|nr:twin-arginine translocase subunit TatC [Clostridium aceticum]AKL94359.1 twin arginine-targeting protein translocase TatC [Clostridium aceticum]
MQDIQLTLIEHLGELRKRIIIIAISIIAGALISYNYIDKIMKYIIKPGKSLEFIYVSPPELFLEYVKISFVVGTTMALPIILFQIWLFIRPGLKGKEQKYLLLAMNMGILFFIIGIAFAYFIVIPIIIQFFVSISVDKVSPLFSFAKYVSFMSSLLLSFGLIFELPMLVLLLTQLGLINPNMLKKHRKIAVFIIFLLATILTPPDIVSQFLLAGPMILLYEFSIFLSSFVYSAKNKKIRIITKIVIILIILTVIIGICYIKGLHHLLF